MNPMIVRQVANDAIFALDILLAGIIILHLFQDVRRRGMIPAYKRLGNQAAVAIFVHVVGVAIERGWHVVNGVRTWDTVPIAGLFFSIAGIMCAIRIFIPQGCWKWAWFGSPALAFAFIAIRFLFFDAY